MSWARAASARCSVTAAFLWALAGWRRVARPSRVDAHSLVPQAEEAVLPLRAASSGAVVMHARRCWHHTSREVLRLLPVIPDPGTVRPGNQRVAVSSMCSLQGGKAGFELADNPFQVFGCQKQPCGLCLFQPSFCLGQVGT